MSNSAVNPGDSSTQAKAPFDFAGFVAMSHARGFNKGAVVQIIGGAASKALLENPALGQVDDHGVKNAVFKQFIKRIKGFKTFDEAYQNELKIITETGPALLEKGFAAINSMAEQFLKLTKEKMPEAMAVRRSLIDMSFDVSVICELFDKGEDSVQKHLAQIGGMVEHGITQQVAGMIADHHHARKGPDGYLKSLVSAPVKHVSPANRH